jgi:hypothetical protein
MSASRRFLQLTLVGLAALVLSACAGNIPTGGLSVEDVEFDASTSEVEFVGPVEAIASISWTVGGVPVSITTATEIDSGLTIGDLAKVHAMVGADSNLAAREIKAVEAPSLATGVESSGSEVEFVGAVVSIGTDSWVVGDQTLALTPETEIKDAIVVGDMVKVHALTGTDGSFTAREIELAGDQAAEGDDKLHFFGVVETIQADSWVVGGTTFMIGPDTEIEAGIVVGDSVKVEAILQTDGSYLAHEIKLGDEDESNDGDSSGPGDGETDFFGQVTAMNADSWVVGGLTFVITADTEIKDVIALGDFVKVEAAVGADGTLTAHEIELEDDDSIGDDDMDDDDGQDDDSDDNNNESDDDSDDDEDDDHSGSGGSGGSDDDDSGSGGSGGSDDD